MKCILDRVRAIFRGCHFIAAKTVHYRRDVLTSRALITETSRRQPPSVQQPSGRIRKWLERAKLGEASASARNNIGASHIRRKT